MSIRRLFSAALMAALLLAALCGAAGPARAAALDEDQLYGEALLLMDADTGDVLYSKNAGERMYPASTTKILTLLLALESDIGLDTIVTIPSEAGNVPEGSSVIPVRPGDKTPFGDLLYGFMLNSGNDGANAIAVLVSGSISAFVERMNARAAELGCEGTHFANAHGYQNSKHYTTAMDLARITRAAMENADFRAIVAAPNYTVRILRGEKKVTVEIPSRVNMVRSEDKYYYADCTGVKTGHTHKAGYCFVGTASRGGVNLLCVTLKCPKEDQKWYDAARLFEYGFGLYEPRTVGSLLQQIAGGYARVTVANAAEEDPEGCELTLTLGPVQNGDATRMVRTDSAESLERALDELRAGAKVEWTRRVAAPVTAGEKLGTLRCTLSDGQVVSAPLLAARDVARRQDAPLIEAEGFPWMPVGLGAAAVAAAVLMIVAARRSAEAKRRRKKKRARRRQTPSGRSSGAPRQSAPQTQRRKRSL